MKNASLLLPGFALGAAVLLWSSAGDLHGYSTIGGDLDLTQRDFRILDNFTDPTANDNQTSDDSFPGASGAAMAIWKASVEWGSEKHGDGNGDPHQILGLGSGGANFDPSYQGLATSVGTTDDNVHSQISGSSGGILAYTETPISDGWRIRYYSDWTWEDGPGTSVGFGKIDIQGVACHEYGHALGLGHSTVAGTTMYASIAGTGVTQRSIAADDQAGIQALYGARSAGKPRITSVSISGGQIVLHGTNFPAGGGEVWFTRGSAGGDGTPVKVTGAASPDGTHLTVAIPASAGPGDVLVKGPGWAHADLSNAWPTDLQPTCPAPSSYCATSPNSVGAGAVIGSLGTTSVSAADLYLTADGCPGQQFGLFYYGASQIAVPFGDGIRCVGGGGIGLFRLGVVLTDPLGGALLKVNYGAPQQASGAGALLPGGVWNAQFWYRDPSAGASGFNFSDARRFTFCQ